MAKHKFQYPADKTIEFEELAANDRFKINVSQPAKIAGRYTGQTTVFVNKVLSEFHTKNLKYSGRVNRTAETIPILDAVHVGITTEKLSIGMPEGVYVPLKYNAYTHRFEIVLDDLVNDEVILDPLTAPKAVVEETAAKED